MCMIVYYHYTDKDGLQGILKSRKIKMSPSGRYGKGVYLTKLAPVNGREKISMNNWGGTVAERSGKVDYAISVKLPKNKVQTHGDIFLFPEDVAIDQTVYELFSKHGDHQQFHDPGASGGEPEDPLLLLRRIARKRKRNECKTM